MQNVLDRTKEAITEERTNFENWYRSFRKIERDETGRVIGNIPGMETLLTQNETGYVYGQPNACWRSWLFRAQLGPSHDERASFEQWYRGYRGEYANDPTIWADLIRRNSLGYVNSRTIECARAWSARYMLDKAPA